MAKFPVNVKSEILSKRLNQAIDRATRATGKTLVQVIMEAGKMFGDAAAGFTPPKGKRIKAAKFKRTIIKESNPENPKRRRYRVLFKRGNRRRDKGAWYETSAKAAKGRAEIHYRGVMKAGWWIAANMAKGIRGIGKHKVGKKVKEIPIGNLGFAQVSRNIMMKPSLTMQNLAFNVESIGRYAARHALAKTNRMVWRWAKRVEKEARRAFA